VGVVVLGQSIADFIIDFNLITGADIALAVPADSNEDGELFHWHSKVAALTDAPDSQNYCSIFPHSIVILQNWIKAI